MEINLQIGAKLAFGGLGGELPRPVTGITGMCINKNYLHWFQFSIN